MNLCVVLVLEACVQYGQFGLCAVAVCNPVVQYANGLLNKCLFVVRFIRYNCLSPFRQYNASVAFWARAVRIPDARPLRRVADKTVSTITRSTLGPLGLRAPYYVTTFGASLIQQAVRNNNHSP